jgi:hypothetical protein
MSDSNICNCLRCGGTWTKRITGRPLHCPKCQHPDWDKTPIVPQKERICECLPCGHTWLRKGSGQPLLCPKCKHGFWDLEPLILAPHGPEMGQATAATADLGIDEAAILNYPSTILPNCECLLCKYQWTRKRSGKPLRCPKCKQHEVQEMSGGNSQKPISRLPLTILLPNSCPRNRGTYLKLLSTVRPDSSGGEGFEGPSFKPGSKITTKQLGERPVLLEYAGPEAAQGNYQRRREAKEHLWLVWRFDWQARSWREIARALAVDWSWAVTLRPAALRALRPVRAISDELPEVRAAALANLSDSITARLVVQPPLG